MTRYIDTHELSEPWAQHTWRIEYSIFHHRYAPLRRREKSRRIMLDYRREAALERKLAAAQRTIEAQALRIKQLEDDVDGFERDLLIEDSMWVESAS